MPSKLAMRNEKRLRKSRGESGKVCGRMVDFDQEWRSHFHFMSDLPRKGICRAVVKQDLSHGGFALCPRSTVASHLQGREGR